MKMSSEKRTSRCDQLFDPAEKIADFDTDDSIHEALCFREDLIVNQKNECSSDTKPVGGYCIAVERIGTEGNEFMIQVLSSLTANDCLAGSKVLASSTARFHCLEEKRTEYIDRCDGLYEKTLYLGLEEEVYHIEVEDSCPCNKSISKIDLPLCSNGEIISEGVNVLLMRYLALKNFHGSLSFFGLTIEGRLTTSNYRCSEARRMKFNGHEVEVYTVERKIREECGLVHDSKTLLTKNGRILRHDWLELPYLLKINSLLDPNEVGDQERRIHPPSRLSSDIQLMSMYLDKKTCQMAQQTEYLADHPEIKQLISDFTQSLLAVKPVNVLSYAIQHFAAFAKNPEVVGSGESNLGLILSQLSKQKVKRVCSVCGICFEYLMSTQLSPGIKSSVTPVASPCSVFAECPSNAPCNLRQHLCRKMNSPVSSFCSVFTKCPSDASCLRKFHSCSDAVVDCLEDCKGCKSDNNRRSVCSLYPECEKTCEGCKSDKNRRSVCSLRPECENTCEGCKIDETRRSVCSLHPKCEKTCEGCKRFEKRRSVCSLYPECEKTCAGCKKGEKRRSVCSLYPECEKTCEGCKKGEKRRSVCSLYPECEKTCAGCKKGEKRPSVCSLGPECEKTCEGCRELGAKACPVLKDCPECPGCREVCNKTEVCPDCRGCNGGVELSTKEEQMH